MSRDEIIPGPSYANPRLPLYLRVWLAGVHRADGEGVSTWVAGELRLTVDPTDTLRSQEISRAIASAVVRGLLAPGSRAHRLVLRTQPSQSRWSVTA